MYIVVEGLDLSGKSSLCKKLIRHYQAEGIVEPYQDTLLAKSAYDRFVTGKKGDYLAAHLMMLTRIELFKAMGEKLAKGQRDIVIADRSFMSTMVYQSTTPAGMEAILELNKEVIQTYGHDVFPDVIILIDCSYSTIMSRIALRKKIDERDKQVEYRVYYHQMMSRYYAAAELIERVSPRTHIVRIDYRTAFKDLISLLDSYIDQ